MSIMELTRLAVCMAILATLVVLVPHYYCRFFQKLPQNEAADAYFFLDDLWSEEELKSLRQLVKSTKQFHTAAQDLTSQNDEFEVKTELNPDGTCPHSYLVPNGDHCILPGRIDMFRHYAKTGGKYGAKEPVEKLVSNVQSFQQYLFGQDLERPELKSLFNSDQYKNASRAVCGPDHPFYKQVQVNLIIMVPGQDLPMHYDLPWFRSGANRFNLPQWLLLAMAGSKLWKEDQLPQVQGVAYVHEMQDIQGGNFFFYPKGPGGGDVSFKSKANSGIVLDGIKTIHGVERFRHEDTAPKIGKGQHFLTYQDEHDLWWLTDPNGQKIASYNSSDLRISLVWRSICFKSREELTSWNPLNFKSVNGNEILQRLEDLLRAEGILSGKRPDPVEFALMLMEHFVIYPIDNWRNAWFPFNYCALPESFSHNSNLKIISSEIMSLIC